MKKRLTEFVIVVISLLLLTLIFWFTDADRFIAFFVPRSGSAWPLGAKFPWNILYDWAPIPAFVLAGLALLVLLTGFFLPRYAPWRKKAVFILLFLILGPGLVINTLLKDQLGRARPREVVEFGGTHQFTQCWQPGTTGANSSFPSGHAAIAFSVMAPWFVLREEKQSIAASFLFFGLTFGLLVGIARILQGGHFASDILWSGGLLYLIGSVLVIIMGLVKERGSTASC